MKRTVKICTISLEIPILGANGSELSKETRKKQRMLNIEKWIKDAAKYKPDVICLPEVAATGPGTTKSDVEIIPNGKISCYFADKARQHKTYIITSIQEIDKGNIYNTAVLFDRKGRLAGKYRKTHLAGFGEWSPNVIAGNELPVFETDFGKIAILLCIELAYIEICRVYMLKGAEMIFWPTMWSPMTDIFLEAHLKGHAVMNGVYMVSSNYVWIRREDAEKKPFGRSMIVDPNGVILDETGRKPGVAKTTIILDDMQAPFLDNVDLAMELPEKWRREKMITTRRPELYSIINKLSS